MQGVSVIYDLDGKPTVITIDLRLINDERLQALVDKVLELLKADTGNAPDGDSTVSS